MRTSVKVSEDIVYGLLSRRGPMLAAALEAATGAPRSSVKGVLFRLCAKKCVEGTGNSRGKTYAITRAMPRPEEVREMRDRRDRLNFDKIELERCWPEVRA